MANTRVVAQEIKDNRRPTKPMENLREEHGVTKAEELHKQNFRGANPPGERLMQVFGIVVLLFGFAAMGELRLRVAPVHDASTPPSMNTLRGGTARGTDDELQWLAWKLNLDHAQAERVKPLLEEEIRKRSAFLATASVSDSEQRAQLVDLRNRTLEQIRPVLTERQKRALNELEREGQS
jgi:hypothetical protein